MDFITPVLTPGPPLLKAKDAPAYMREISITTGYRQRLSYRACVCSWFWIHNETVNIWSHLIGFLIFLYCLAIIVFWPVGDSYLEILPLIIQLISYQVCMLSSTLFHTFSCHSEEAHDSWQETDHLGILCALFGTYISLLSITFSCFPLFKIIHLSIVVVIFFLVVSLRYLPYLFGQKWSSQASPKIPLSLFLAVSLYSVVPLSHWVWLHGGISNDIVQEKLQQIFLPFVIGGVGLVFYVTRFPEKIFRAGTVDILGSSHQVWHVMIFLGMAFWYKETSSSLLEARKNVCSDDSGNSTYTEFGPLREKGTDILKSLVSFVRLEEILHYPIGEVFNIF